MTDRRKLFRESKSNPSQTTQRGNYSTSWFLLLPLALLAYVFVSVQKEYSSLEEDYYVRGDVVTQQLYEYGENVTRGDPSSSSFSLSSQTFPKSPMQGLWISVESWAQENVVGPLEWKQVFAEVSLVALRLDAVLVEPSIVGGDGRLVPCGGAGSIPMSDVYNRSLLMAQDVNDDWKLASTSRRFFLATCTEYHSFQNQLTAPTIYNICLGSNDGGNGNGGGRDCVTEEGEWLTPSYFQQTSIDLLDQAVNDVRNDPSSIVLIKLHNVGASAFQKLTVQLSPLPPSDNDHPHKKKHRHGDSRVIRLYDPIKIQNYMSTHMRFRQDHYDFLDAQLRKAKIASYAVIEWRNHNVPGGAVASRTTSSSRTSASKGAWMDCAEQILDAQQAMDPDETMTFFISTQDPRRKATTISNSVSKSVTTATTTKVGGVAKANTIQEEDERHEENEALDFLIGKGGFQHLDQFLTLAPIKDPIILYTVMNMILVEHAVAFSTCSERCPTRYGTCHKCSFRSSSSTVGTTSRTTTTPTSTSRGEDFLLLQTRDQGDSQTLPCWPETSHQVSSINKLWTKH